MASPAPQPEPQPERYELGTRPARLRSDAWAQPPRPPDREAARASDPYRTRLPSFAEVVARPSWHARAACRGMGPELFFPELGQPYDSEAARTVCASCPVAAPCSAAAHAGNEHGLWGGLWQKQRKALRARLRQGAP